MNITMSWLLFLDESGHDHKNTPYEVRGGFAIHQVFQKKEIMLLELP
jgi:hypothetical protein